MHELLRTVFHLFQPCKMTKNKISNIIPSGVKYFVQGSHFFKINLYEIFGVVAAFHPHRPRKQGNSLKFMSNFLNLSFSHKTFQANIFFNTDVANFFPMIFSCSLITFSMSICIILFAPNKFGQLNFMAHLALLRAQTNNLQTSKYWYASWRCF